MRSSDKQYRKTKWIAAMYRRDLHRLQSKVHQINKRKKENDEECQRIESEIVELIENDKRQRASSKK